MLHENKRNHVLKIDKKSTEFRKSYKLQFPQFHKAMNTATIRNPWGNSILNAQAVTG
jgi:hypothetical protein